MPGPGEVDAVEGDVAAAGEQAFEQGLGVHGSGSLVVDGGKEGLGVEDRQPLGLGDAQLFPDVQGVTAVAEALQPLAQAGVLRLQRFQGQVGLDTDQRQRRRAEGGRSSSTSTAASPSR